eukprot:11053988-Ditylum_brightwellii.AAC.1
MAHEEGENGDGFIGSYVKGFDPGLQRSEEGWNKVDNNKHRNHDNKKNKEKDQKTSGEKRKNDKVNGDNMDEEEEGNWGKEGEEEMEDAEENKSKKEENKQEGSNNDKKEDMETSAGMDVNVEYDEEEGDPIPVEGKTIREQIMEAGEKDMGKRSVLVTTIRT